MTDIILETVRAIVLLGILIFLWSTGHNRFKQSQKGWNIILLGFGLLFFGSVLDISDNFENLNRFIVIGDTETEAFLEKFVGFLGGFIFLAVGLFKWVPGVHGLSELVDNRTRELQETNASLQKSRESFKALADNLPVFISLKDPQGRFQFVNKSFEEWVCVNSDEIVGKTVHDIYPREQAAEFAARDQEAIDSQSVMSQEIEISYPDGYTRTVISTRFPVLSSADDVIGLGTINFDITEHKRAEKAKNEFISTVSHELRTPLTSIKGSLGLIAGGALGAMSDKAKAMVEVAHQNTERLIKLVNDILDMEKIEAGRMDFNMEPVDIVSLVKSAIEANNGFCADLGVTFVQVALEEKNFVHGDRGRLMQVLSNLMSNAAKFSPHGGRVDISVTRQGDTVRIALKDSGPGIPEEFRKSIFEKFTQADSSDSRQKGGTGLGLSIAKSIVERHHGDLGCESEVGAGSTFFFTLPVSD